MSTETDYHHKLQDEFAVKLLAIQDAARRQLSPIGWFLLTSAICSLGETSRTVYPSLSHSRTRIEELGPTYKVAFGRLEKSEQDTIQAFYRQFVDSLSYGKPTRSQLMD